MIVSCLTFNEKYNAYMKSIKNNRNIVVFGQSGSGKTFVWESIPKKLRDSYFIYTRNSTNSSDSNPINNQSENQINLYIEMDETPTMEDIELLTRYNFDILYFEGYYDKITKNYQSLNKLIEKEMEFFKYPEDIEN